MLSKLAIALVLIGMVFANPQQQQHSLFSKVASQFNTFVEGNFECHASETLGRLGAGGNINISSYAVACGLLNPYTTTCLGATSLHCGQLGQATHCDSSSRVCEYGLVCGNNLACTNGALRLGSLSYVNKLTTDSSFSVQCQKKKISLVNFSSEFSELRSTSSRLAQLHANGHTSISGPNIQLSGDGSNNVQIFSISCSQFAAATSVTLTRVSSTTTVIINIGGSSSCSIKNKGFSGFNPAYTVFNFPSATSLSCSGIGLTGTLLAPNANIFEPLNGNIQGHIFCKSWIAKHNGCIEQQWYPFKGRSPL
jgi:choice-of-anchor A domain-containing protein